MRYAETVAEVGLYPLRRRDRAAMVLALECLRESGPRLYSDDQRAAEDALREAWDVLAACRYPRSVAWAVAPDLVVCGYIIKRHRWRLLRARLALLLRVLLRVDAGDYGRRGCSVCRERIVPDDVEAGDASLGWHLPCVHRHVWPWGYGAIRPLWEAA